jgi:enterochelin esterase-like enzyme
VLTALGVYHYSLHHGAFAHAPTIAVADHPIDHHPVTVPPLVVKSFESRVLGQNRQYGVILPPDYNQNPTRRYPVIILLHGGHNNFQAYTEHYGLTPVLEKLYTQGQLPPALIVIPDGNDLRGSSALWDPAYYNGPHGNLDTFIGAELVQHLKVHYRTLPSPQFWAMGGVSSGGWGAFNIGLRHLDVFGTLFSHSGYFTDASGAVNSPERFIRTLPRAVLSHLGAYIDAGSSPLDEEERTSSQQFQAVLNQLGVPNVLHIFPGGHGMSGPDVGWNYFRKHLMDSLTYVGQRFKTP